jgi:hypothetical protein
VTCRSGRNDLSHCYCRSLRRDIHREGRSLGNDGVSGGSGRRPGPTRSAKLPRRDASPALVGDLLAQTRVRTRAAAGVALDREAWRRIVGARIAHATVPGRIQNRVLTVSAASAVWVHELSLLSDEIVARLKTSGLGVDSIRFRVTATARSQSAPRAERPLPIALPAELEDRLSQVDDPELRKTIARAAAYSLAATSARPAAPNPRSAGPRSAQPGPAAPARPAKPRRTRGDPAD